MDYRESIDRLLSLVDHERTGHPGPRQKAIDNLDRVEALMERLDDVVGSCVNNVGVELNTASGELLSYVSGLGPSLA